jgi:D-glycero-D-manno-heptose 1,7-bisphosphate phosphatase
VMPDQMSSLPLKTKLVILDRDGVVNYDSSSYVKSADEWLPLPDSIEAISELTHAGILVCVVTNQSGLGRGYFEISDFIESHEKLDNLLQPLGGNIDAVFFCPHSPDESCECRKPKPTMALEALTRFQISAENSVFVGDSLRDLQSAEKAGILPVLVKTGNGSNTLLKTGFSELETESVPIFENLAGFVSSLLKKKNPR